MSDPEICVNFCYNNDDEHRVSHARPSGTGRFDTFTTTNAIPGKTNWNLSIFNGIIG